MSGYQDQWLKRWDESAAECKARWSCLLRERVHDMIYPPREVIFQYDCTTGACTCESGTRYNAIGYSPSTGAVFYSSCAKAFQTAKSTHACGLPGVITSEDQVSGKITPPPPGNVLAGSGLVGQQDGPATRATFNEPYSLALDSRDRVYVVGYRSANIRLIDNGQVTTLNSGTGLRGFRDGPVKDAQFDWPRDLAVTPAGDLLVADYNNCRIRLLSGGTVSTLAGDGTCGFLDGLAASARFNLPEGVAVDPAGAVYVADSFNFRVRKIQNGQVSTLAGNGKAAMVNGPVASASFIDPLGVAAPDGKTIFVVGLSGLLRKISAGQVSNVPVNKFDMILRLSAGQQGELFVIQSNHSVFRVAGEKRSAFYPKLMQGATDLAVDSKGRVIFADRLSHQIKVITR